MLFCQIENVTNNYFTQTLMDLKKHGIMDLEGGSTPGPKNREGVIYASDKIECHLSELFRDVRSGKFVPYTPRKVCSDMIEHVERKKELDNFDANNVVLTALAIRKMWEHNKLRTVKGKFNFVIADQLYIKNPNEINVLETLRYIEMTALQPSYA